MDWTAPRARNVQREKWTRTTTRVHTAQLAVRGIFLAQQVPRQHVPARVLWAPTVHQELEMPPAVRAAPRARATLTAIRRLHVKHAQLGTTAALLEALVVQTFARQGPTLRRDRLPQQIA